MRVERGPIELVGASFVGLGPVQQLLHFPFRAELTALYGLNGSGKTSVLRGLDYACSGVADPESKGICDLHVRLDVEDYPDSDFCAELVVKALGQKLAQLEAELRMNAASVGEDPPDLPDRSSGVFSPQDPLHYFVDLHLRMNKDIPPDVSDALRSACDYGSLTLRASGTTERPSWDVFLSANISWGMPFEERLREIGNQMAASTAAHEDDQQLLNEYYDSQQKQILSKKVGLAWSGDALSPYILNNTAKVSRRRIVAPHEAWPSWLHLPLLYVATVERPPVSMLGREMPVDQLNEETRKLVFENDRLFTKSSIVQISGHGESRVNAKFLEDAGQLSTAASLYFKKFIADAPALAFDLKEPGDWVLNSPPEWKYVEQSDKILRSLDRLSSAQLRWAQTAIGLTLSQASEVPVVFLCDEPEKGLHPIAVRNLFDGLFETSAALDAAIVMATHSPIFFDPLRVSALRVSRDNDWHTQLFSEKIDVADELRFVATALALGMASTDAVGLIRRIIAVEGIHDQLVFNTLLRDHLVGGQIILPMHGAKYSRSLIDQNLLLTLTRAPITIVLDNVANTTAQQIKQDINTAIMRDDISGAHELAKTLSASSKGEEGDYLASLFRLAIDKSMVADIELYGLDMPDVICYLPCDYMLNKKSLEWTALISEWRELLEKRSDTPKGFKKWLKKRSLLPQSDEEITDRVAMACRRLSETSGPLPFDLDRLAILLNKTGP